MLINHIKIFFALSFLIILSACSVYESAGRKKFEQDADGRVQQNLQSYLQTQPQEKQQSLLVGENVDKTWILSISTQEALSIVCGDFKICPSPDVQLNVYDFQPSESL